MDLKLKSTGMQKCQDVKLNTDFSVRYTIDSPVDNIDNRKAIYNWWVNNRNIKYPDSWNVRFSIAESACNHASVQNINGIVGNPIFQGSVTLVNGESGTGKTTFLLQVCSEYAKKYKVGFVSGEQSVDFIKQICDNCLVTDVDVGNITDMDEIINLMDSYQILVIDSFPCLTYDEVKYGKKAATAKVQFMIDMITAAAKEKACAVMMVLHSTKSGAYRGPTTLKHTVDNMIKLSRTDSGDVEISLEKSRLAPPSKLYLKFGSHGFNGIRSFREIDNLPIMDCLMKGIYSTWLHPASYYKFLPIYTYDWCCDFLINSAYEIARAYPNKLVTLKGMCKMVYDSLNHYYKFNKLEPEAISKFHNIMQQANIELKK